jgi:hypothetical protein
MALEPTKQWPPPSFVRPNVQKVPVFMRVFFYPVNNILNVKETNAQNWQPLRTHGADASTAPTVFRSPRGPTFELHRICFFPKPRRSHGEIVLSGRVYT